jgi:hypothetical protein
LRVDPKILQNNTRELINHLDGFIEFFLSRNLTLSLFGGGARELVSSSGIMFDLPTDLDFDFEIRSEKVLYTENFLKDLSKDLEREFQIKCKILKFNICKIMYKGISIEIGIPRIENYIIGSGAYSHDEFTAEYSLNMEYEDSSCRRDLSLNSFCVEINSLSEFAVKDPYEGIEDLHNKVLRHISNNFFLDPVRFLRLIRFSQMDNFKISESTRDRLGEFNLLEMSHHYFFKEAFTISFGDFLERFFIETEKNKISYPEYFDSLKALSKQKSFKYEKLIEGVIHSFMLGEMDLESVSTITEKFSLSKKEIKNLRRFYDHFYMADQINWDEISQRDIQFFHNHKESLLSALPVETAKKLEAYRL